MPSDKDTAYVSPATVRWAIDRAGITFEELANRLKDTKPSQVMAWARGESSPRFSQAEKLADKLRIPLAVLFMKEPPQITLPIPDLRTVGNVQQARPSLDFLDVLNDALIKQQWYRAYEEEQQAPSLQFVGSFAPRDDATAVATNMAGALGINNAFRHQSGGWQQFLTAFIHKAEDLGVLVMRGRVVRHDVTRKLNPKEFRGFVISDNLAPLIFINAADAKAAQIFTLAHELAHIWIGQSGISNINPQRRESKSTIERFCNQVAAELLVPRTGFERLWVSNDISSNVRRIAAFFRVSAVVVLMRAYELSKVDYSIFSELMDAEYERFQRYEAQKEQEETTGNFWASFTARNGRRLTKSVVASFREGHLLYTEAASLLGLKVKTFNKYLQGEVGE